jgi:hypothetical protein
MPIPTRPSITGFFKSDPQLTESEDGTKRLHAFIGIEQSERNEDGSFIDLEPYSTHLVMFGKSAERAAEKFASGDLFIAVGRTNTREVNGAQEEQFIASRIGHDNNRATYTVQRGATRAAAGRDESQRTQDRDPAEAALAQREGALDPGPEAVVPTAAGRDALTR